MNIENEKEDEHSVSSERSDEFNSEEGSKNSHTSSSNKDDNSFRIAEREDLFVVRMKVIVVISIVLSATALALVALIITLKEEYQDFQNQVSNFFFANKIYKINYLLYDSLCCGLNLQF